MSIGMREGTVESEQILQSDETPESIGCYESGMKALGNCCGCLGMAMCCLRTPYRTIEQGKKGWFSTLVNSSVFSMRVFIISILSVRI
jgi:hypothetical protein